MLRTGGISCEINPRKSQSFILATFGLSRYLSHSPDLFRTHANFLAGQSIAAQTFRRDTLLFIEHCLGLSSTESEAPLPPSQGVATFTELGDLLKAQYSITQRKRWFHEASFFFNMVKVEQEYIIADQVPTLEDFWTMRMGSSAVGQSNALGE